MVDILLFVETKHDLVAQRRLSARLFDLPGGSVRPAEVDADVRPQGPLHAGDVRLIEDTLPHGHEQLVEVRSAEVGPAVQLRQRILGAADRVQHDVLRRVDVESLRQVGVDPEELEALAARLAGRRLGLGFERGEQGLEPFEGAGVLADPDKLDAAEAPGRVGRVANVPNVLEDRGPGGDADAGADEDRNFIVKNLRTGSVDAVEAEQLEDLHPRRAHHKARQP